MYVVIVAVAGRVSWPSAAEVPASVLAAASSAALDTVMSIRQISQIYVLNIK